MGKKAKRKTIPRISRVEETSSAEKIEGLEEADDSGLSGYPIDTLLIRTENRTVFDVVRRINSDGFIMNPDFQRDFVWNAEKQSKLIESVIMRIPLPVFYLAEDKKGKTIVVDGLQRLSTFRAFLNGEFKLKLPHQQTLHNCRFSDLSAKLQNRIEDCNLVLYLIDSKVPERAKLDIFERVNSGEVLTRQQMRNCLHSGPATKWLKDEAETELFVTATGKSLDVKRMRDREFINRFCAFDLIGFKDYKPEMDDFLAQSLEIMNELTVDALSSLSKRLRTTLENNLQLFGRHAFRKHKQNQSDRSVINASLWDVMSVYLAKIPVSTVRSNLAATQSEFYQLLADKDFNEAITYSPNSSKNVKKRFELAGAMFRELYGDYTP